MALFNDLRGKVHSEVDHPVPSCCSLEEVEDLHVAVLEKSAGDGIGVCVFVVPADSLLNKDAIDSNGLGLCVNRRAENRLRQLCFLKGVNIQCLNRYFFLKELPLNTRGKVDGLKLVQDAKQCVLLQNGTTVRSELKPQLVELIKKVEDLVGCSVNVDEDLMSLGLDSLDTVRLHRLVRDSFPNISLRHFLEVFNRRSGQGMTISKLFVLLEKSNVGLGLSSVYRNLFNNNILFRPFSSLDGIIHSVHQFPHSRYTL